MNGKIGTLATSRPLIRTDPLKHGHVTSALMDDRKADLPAAFEHYNLRELLQFEGRCAEKSNHTKEGFRIYCDIRCRCSEGDELIGFITALLTDALIEIE